MARLTPEPSPFAPVSSPTAPANTVPQDDDPRRFLLAVMNDPSVAMELRIKAAKALLHP